VSDRYLSILQSRIHPSIFPDNQVLIHKTYSANINEGQAQIDCLALGSFKKEETKEAD
jgi:hypothetical protein